VADLPLHGRPAVPWLRFTGGPAPLPAFWQACRRQHVNPAGFWQAFNGPMAPAPAFRQACQPLDTIIN
jgi:hypothetical protein